MDDFTAEIPRGEQCHEGPTPSAELCVTMQAITKGFPGVRALDKVDLQLRKGEIMGLVGENGAGKSTLMKVLSGAYIKDSGSIYFNGREVNLEKPVDALKLGIHVIYQEPDLVPVLTVKENVFLGHAINRFGILSLTEMKKRTGNILNDLGFDIDPDINLEKLSVAQQQIVAIAKALSEEVHVLVLDEPAAVLPDRPRH